MPKDFNPMLSHAERRRKGTPVNQETIGQMRDDFSRSMAPAPPEKKGNPP